VTGTRADGGRPTTRLDDQRGRVMSTTQEQTSPPVSSPLDPQTRAAIVEALARAIVRELTASGQGMAFERRGA
jgi:hypothetical protein